MDRTLGHTPRTDLVEVENVVVNEDFQEVRTLDSIGVHHFCPHLAGGV
jgi:hypothetical protein